VIPKNLELRFSQLKYLQITHEGWHQTFVDSLLKSIETPALEKFVFVGRYSNLNKAEAGLEFAVKWSNHKLKQFSIACDLKDVGYWHEFLWTGHTLKITECKYPQISKYISKFVEDHAAEKFSKIKKLLIYRSDLPHDTGSLLFKNAINIEAFSTDYTPPCYGTEEMKYQKLKVLKLWAFRSDTEKIYRLSRSFPNLETFLVCESYYSDLGDVIRSSLPQLKEYRHGMSSAKYHSAHPEHVHTYSL
jgi:hypothetical protein